MDVSLAHQCFSPSLSPSLLLSLKINKYNLLKKFKRISAFSGMETDSDMTQVLGLADKHLKTAIKTMPTDVQESMLTENKNIESLSREIKTIRKNQMENI